MLSKRIFIVLPLVPIVLALIFYAPPAFFKGFVVVCIAGALWEYFRIVAYSKRQMIAGILLGILHSGFLLFLSWTGEVLLMEQAAILLALFILFVFIAPRHLEGSFSQLGFTFLGVIYVATLTSFVGLVRDLPEGAKMVLLLLSMTWMNDTAAYFFGHYLGKRRLAPQLSPGKTVEGFLGGFAGTGLAFLVLNPFFQDSIPFSQGLILVLLIGLMGPLGDLSESLMKRNFGVKDSGQMIPGHGGILDRIDALLFTAPVFYMFIKYFVEIK